MHRRLPYALCPLLLALTAALACGPGKGGSPPEVPVVTATVERRDVPALRRAVGTVEPIESASVRAQVTGIVAGLLFREGDEVRAGQPLVALDARPFTAALGMAEARLERAQAEAAHARAQARRYADLLAQGFASASQAEAAQTEAEALAAAAEEARQAVVSAQLDLGYATARAPIAGRAGAALVKKGNVVKANEATLVTVHQTAPIRVAFAVPSEALAEVRRALASGSPEVRATLPGSAEPARGELVFVDNAVDAGTGTLALKAQFPNGDGLLWPGQVVDVTLVVGVERGVAAVPESAVLEGQQGTYAFVVEGGLAKRRSVEVLRTEEGWAAIASGLQVGETVVSEGQLRLSEGTKVQAQAAAPGEPR